MVLSTVKHLGSLKIVEAVDATTTHIIVGGPRRTLAVLEGMARGCWILKPEWVFVSLEKGAFSPFLSSRVVFLEAPRPNLCRHRPWQRLGDRRHARCGPT